MKNIFRILLISLFCLIFVKVNYARENKFGEAKSKQSIKSTAAGCLAPSGFKFLQINNVRVRINTGGDMWWNFEYAQYYIPAETNKTPLFSGSLWIGGLDINNQLKLAALTYRQGGQDYWTGPLTMDGSAAIDYDVCAEWDKMFEIRRDEVDEFIGYSNSTNKGEEYPGYTIPKSIIDYPAHGDVSQGQSFYLAPFKDVDGSGDYNPESGDYPYYDLENELCPLNFVGDPDYIPTPTAESEFYEEYYGGILVDQVLKGDETLWWIFNDKGNVHGETDGSPIGMEIRAQAFGFQTNDEINNMTFYSYEIINRSTYELTNTYFSPWVDTDLGNADDDYVGCDVNRGLGYCYNGQPIDAGGPESYGDQPPAVGVDFFQGPYMDADTSDNPSYFGDGLLGPAIENCSMVTSDGQDLLLTYGPNDEFSGVFRVSSAAINGINFGNGIVDDERYGMRRFVYYNNDGSVIGNPSGAADHYNYLRGIWRDNTKMLYGENGHINTGSLGPECDFMFPFDSDPCNWGTGGLPPNGGLNQNGNYWTEETAGTNGNNPDDRRFMQSAGPFTLKPGAVNYITVGIPWARAVSGGPWESVKLLRVVDDKCQALFDNCFKVIDGPDAPDLTFKEYNNELIVYITNSENSNNFVESYQEKDPTINTPDSLADLGIVWDPYYRFEGYQIFQVKDPSVTLSESRYDANKVRMVAQIDVQNGVAQLVNYKYDQTLGANVPVEEAIDADNGVVHTYSITEDLFATSNRTLVNNKHYYYSVIAYGYNMFKEYDANEVDKLNGQKTPYLAGRKNIQLYTAIPHIAVNGVVANASYGDGPQITRVEGRGNGGLSLEFTEESIEELLAKSPAGITETGDIVQYGDDNYPIVYNPVYKAGKGPVDIKVIDPLNVINANYTLQFDTVFNWFTFENYTGSEDPDFHGDTVGVTSTPSWYLIDEETGDVYKSDTSTHMKYEQLFIDLGISIDFGPVFYGGPYKIGVVGEGSDATQQYELVSQNNALISATIEYSDSSRQWLSGVEDEDIAGRSINWIRSGTIDGDYRSQANPHDPDEIYEKLIGRTWAPYVLCADNAQDSDGAAPAFNSTSRTFNGLDKINSVEIVLTPDKSKWTRSPVIELSDDDNLSEGAAPKYTLRRSASINKEYEASDWPDDYDNSFNPEDPNYVLSYGMSWFPGYAVNLETGERMNIMFGEDSYHSGDRGRDMIFNPTSKVNEQPSGDPIFGGKHYIYIMGSGTYTIANSTGPDIVMNFPAYDAGRQLVRWLDSLTTNPAYYNIYGIGLYSLTQYVSIPLENPDEEWLSNEVKIRINVNRPYAKYFTTDEMDSTSTVDFNERYGESDNSHYPLYTFSMEGLATSFNQQAKAESDLDLINVVPNPYYAFGVANGYETTPLETKVKITNLPERCTVTIYNISGTLVRQYTKDDPVTFLDWDLKNHAGIPIAGGVYLIHVKDENLGQERIVKWFGSLRIEDFKEF